MLLKEYVTTNELAKDTKIMIRQSPKHANAGEVINKYPGDDSAAETLVARA